MKTMNKELMKLMKTTLTSSMKQKKIKILKKTELEVNLIDFLSQVMLDTTTDTPTYTVSDARYVIV